MDRRRVRFGRGGGRGTAAAVTALAALAVAVPAQAAVTPEGAAGGTCKPSVTILQSVPPGTGGPDIGGYGTRVNDIGRFGLAVGASRNVPVYWTGRRVHRVPLPEGFAGGTVEAVNRYGLMVGTIRKAGETRAFSYRPGATAVTLLPGGGHAADVNDRGHIVGHRDVPDGRSVGLEWVGSTLRRELAVPAHVRVAEVTAINNAGRIVGHGDGVQDEEYGYNTALLWSADPAAPATELPPTYPGDTYSHYEPSEIDEHGRIVGSYGFSRHDSGNGTTWAPPYAEHRDVPNLGERTQGSLEDTSPTTGVSVGVAWDSIIVGPWPPETAPPRQAQYWPGSGPMLALPRLVPDGHSAAYAVTDRDRVGGQAVNAAGMQPVIWNCASKQAYLPTVETP
ncbi:hypothetical protein ABZO31_03660 [Streptomyces sp. HUAS MG47]|uniref:hypothetical protein n=1 Tax=Streptomyces solicamelliae TaxID=3231716 RepID=UPI003877F1AA